MNALRGLSLVSSLALSVPLVAQASSFTHDVGGDAGVTFHPDHVASIKSRAEVNAELEAARKDGTLTLMQRGVFLPIKADGPPKSRVEVIAELERARQVGTLPPTGDK